MPIRPADLLHPTPAGLYCPPGDFFVDPVRGVERAVVTHGHSDHARPGHAKALATPETLAIMASRMGAGHAKKAQAVAYGECISINGVDVTLVPAGHVLGSAQVVIEWKGLRIVVSGDYKRAHDPTCATFEPVKADVFVTEATFALPVFRHPHAAEEIAKLMDELRKAMDEYMQMLAREAMQNPLSQNPMMQNELMRMLRQSDLQRMMDQIENLARSGSRDAAREMLSELQRMMDNLRAGRHMQQQQAEGNQMNQALDKLSELMRRQQELMDETFRLEQNNPENRQGEQNRQQQGEGQQMTPEEFAEALKQLQQQQSDLAEQLGELSEQLESLGLDPSEQFGEAQGEMGEAGKNLGRGQPGDATGNQAQALDALRRGVQSMMQQMAGNRQQGGQQQGQGQFGGLDRDRRDPLGRRQENDGYQDSDATRIPGEIDAQRAREIMEAIRERLSEPASPRIEKDYLERLLETE